jgi:hypothetical protein
MPKGIYDRSKGRSIRYRPFEDCRRDLDALRPEMPVTDIRRGEIRLMAEVLIAKQHGEKLELDVELRAAEIMRQAARE